jgi:CheY-like chemotaxis protein
MTTHLERTFRQVAEERDLDFTITLDPALPKAIRTDSKRLLQILRNLLANAFKFTERGSVNLAVTSADGSLLRSGADWLAFAVTDTGIGIAEEKQRIVFEAFQQADGTTSRQYGGTGLGLSISREIARLLGGEIVVESAPGKGSTFTLFVPLAGPPAAAAEGRPLRSESLPAGRPRAGNGGIIQPADDRQRIANGDQIVLIVEDDPTFASVVLELAREKGFRGLVAPDGASALALANRYSPHAITLDIGLPDMDGWALLDMFKRDPRTRDIPIHVITVGEREKRAANAESGGLYL